MPKQRKALPVWKLMFFLLAGTAVIGFVLWLSFRYPSLVKAEAARTKIQKIEDGAKRLVDAKKQLLILRQKINTNIDQKYGSGMDVRFEQTDNNNSLDIRFAGLVLENWIYLYSFTIRTGVNIEGLLTVTVKDADGQLIQEKTILTNLAKDQSQPVVVRLPLFNSQGYALGDHEIFLRLLSTEARVLSEQAATYFFVLKEQKDSQESSTALIQTISYYMGEELIAIETFDNEGSLVKGVYNCGSDGRSIIYNAYYEKDRLATIELASGTPEASFLREHLNANGTPYQREYFIDDTIYPQIRDDDFDNNGSLEHRIYDLNADGVPEAILQDLDGDGIFEIIDEDFDSDGLFVPLGPGLQFFHFG